jgi:hypothetical protein
VAGAPRLSSDEGPQAIGTSVHVQHTCGAAGSTPMSTDVRTHPAAADAEHLVNADTGADSPADRKIDR